MSLASNYGRMKGTLEDYASGRTSMGTETKPCDVCGAALGRCPTHPAQPVSVPWRVGQRRRGVILGAGKYGGKPQDFIVLAGDSYVRTDDGEEWAFGQSWPNELIAEAPECGHKLGGYAQEILCNREAGHEGGHSWRTPEYRLAEQTTPKAPEALPQRPEPAKPGQTWRYKSCGCEITTGDEPYRSGSILLKLKSEVRCERNDSITHVAYYPEILANDATYVSGPVVEQTRPKAPNPETCTTCGGACTKEDLAQSAPGRPFCSYRCFKADCDKAAPSPGAGAGVKAALAPTSTPCSVCGTICTEDDMAHSAGGPPFCSYRCYQAANPSPGEGRQGKEPTLSVPTVCGLTTRSGIPCDLKPTEHIGRGCRVSREALPSGLMKRREMSEADIEREARWPR